MGRKSMAKKPKINRKVYQQAGTLEYDATRIWMQRVRPVCVSEAFTYLMNIGMIVLHDQFGFGKSRLERYAAECFEYMDSIGGRYVTLEEVADEAKKLSGLDCRLQKSEVDELEKYGMTTATKELELTAIQRGYLKSEGFDRRMKK